MKEALDDPDHPVGTIYDYKYVYKTLEKREAFKGGKALFVNGHQPIKCGGAPQKMMYLSEDRWTAQGIKSECTYITPTPILFPNCVKFSEALDEIRKS